MTRALIASALLAAACNIPDVVLIDEGRACVDPVVAGEPASIRVQVCASACAENASARCSVEVRRDAIRIDSEFSWDEPGGACIAVCGDLAASCELPPLAKGNYSIRLGDDTAQLRVGDPEAVCLGSS
jgi:hypothetical protein